MCLAHTQQPTQTNQNTHSYLTAPQPRHTQSARQPEETMSTRQTHNNTNTEKNKTKAAPVMCKWTDQMADPHKYTHSRVKRPPLQTLNTHPESCSNSLKHGREKPHTNTSQHFTASSTFKTTASPLPFKAHRAAAAIYSNRAIQYSITSCLHPRPLDLSTDF